MPQNRETKYNRIIVCRTISWLYCDSELFTRNRTCDNLFISFWILFTVQEIFRNNNSNYKLKTVCIILLWTYLLISSRDTCIYRAWITNFFNIHVTLDITSVIFLFFCIPKSSQNRIAPILTLRNSTRYNPKWLSSIIFRSHFLCTTRDSAIVNEQTCPFLCSCFTYTIIIN